MFVAVLAGFAAPSIAASNAQPDGDWRGYGRSADESRFSPLREIDESTVGRLSPAWWTDLDVPYAASTPLAVDGVLYVAAGFSVVFAIDGTTGKTLWRYDPQVPQVAGVKLRSAWGIRGLAYSDGAVFVGTQDGRLLSIDARNGRLLWSVVTGLAGDGRFITGAPRVMDTLVIIGHAGADTSLMRGYVSAYDRRSGRLVWRFYVVPDNPAVAGQTAVMKMAARTWTGHWWDYGGGGAVWNAMTYDPELKTVYIGTGNGTPYNWKIRNPGRGDNLFLSSIVALDARTGRYKWHYQTNPNEAWDYNACMDMVLATLTIDGTRRKVLMQAPKNGFFYVLDRENGKLLSAEKIVNATWADKIDLGSGRPVEKTGIRYENGETIMAPSYVGAHSWQPMAFSPQTGLVYIPVIEQAARWSDVGIDSLTWKYSGSGFSGALTGFAAVGEGRTSLLAWNPVTQAAAWRVDTSAHSNYGVLATAGRLVFQGEADGTVHAYDPETGRIVWSASIGTPITGPPISYLAGGHQYIAFLVGPVTGGSSMITAHAASAFDYRETPRRLISLRLDGTATLPATMPQHPLDVSITPFDTVIPAGLGRYTLNCSHCHGVGGISLGGAPDLRKSTVVKNAESFRKIVAGGALVANGMPQFAEFDAEELDSIRRYLLERSIPRPDGASVTSVAKPGAR